MRERGGEGEGGRQWARKGAEEGLEEARRRRLTATCSTKTDFWFEVTTIITVNEHLAGVQTTVQCAKRGDLVEINLFGNLEEFVFRGVVDHGALGGLVHPRQQKVNLFERMNREGRTREARHSTHERAA